MSDTRCEDGRVLQHVPMTDDPYYERDVGACGHSALADMLIAALQTISEREGWGGDACRAEARAALAKVQS